MAAAEIRALSDRPRYRHILMRIGVVLIAIGLIDIAWMVHVIREGQAYSSSFKIPDSSGRKPGPISPAASAWAR